MARKKFLFYENEDILKKLLKCVFKNGYATSSEDETLFCGFFGKLALRVSYYNGMFSIDKVGRAKLQGWKEEIVSEIFGREVSLDEETVDYDDYLQARFAVGGFGFDILFDYK